MDSPTFDRLARTVALAATRRAALGTLLAGAALGLGGRPRVAAQPSCTANGQPCQEGAECCSGRCEGQVCQQADNQGVCTLANNACGDATISCGGTGHDVASCSCFVTTEGHSFCGTFGRRSLKSCGCTSHRDCRRRVGFGKGAKCVQSDLGHCGCPAGTQSMCVKRCPHLTPV